MKERIERIGNIQKLNSEGYIINDFSLENIQEDYLVILEDIIKLYKKNYSDILHSIYIRGSVLKGMAVKEISDIDTIGIMKRKLTDDELKRGDCIEIEIG